MTHTEKAINLIEWLLNESGVTAYRIGRDSGLSVTTIDRITKQGKPIENLSLATAIKLETYAIQLQKEEMEKMKKSPMEMVQNRKKEVKNMEGFEDIFANEIEDFKEHAELIEKFGSVKSDYGVLALLQLPYIDGSDDEPYYAALAVNDQGDHCKVTWDVKENWKEIAELGDEQLMCDWDAPTNIDPF